MLCMKKYYLHNMILFFVSSQNYAIKNHAKMLLCTCSLVCTGFTLLCSVAHFLCFFCFFFLLLKIGIGENWLIQPYRSVEGSLIWMLYDVVVIAAVGITLQNLQKSTENIRCNAKEHRKTRRFSVVEVLRCCNGLKQTKTYDVVTLA